MSVQRDDIDNVRVIGIGVIGAFIVAALILFIQAAFLAMEQADAEGKETTPLALRDYQAEQEARLSQYGWVDQSRGLVRIPVDRAMKLTLRDLNRDQPARVKTGTEDESR